MTITQLPPVLRSPGRSPTVTVRELGRTIREDERWVSALVPAGDGLLVAVRR